MRAETNVSPSQIGKTTGLFAAPWSRLAVLLLLALAFFLRTYQLDAQALRGDEAATVLYAALPISDLWELSRITDPHPPLYYLMLHPWQSLVGEGAWAMRFAGVAASTLAVAALYALAQRTLPVTGISLLAAALLSVNPFQIWLAQDIRSYPFFTLLGLLSSLALWWALHREPEEAVGKQKTSSRIQPPAPGTRTKHRALRAIPWLIYLLLTVACLYIHYYTVFLIAFQGLFVMLNLRRFWQKKWPWLVSQMAIGVLIMPGLGLAYNFIGPAAGGIDTIPLAAILQQTSAALLTGFTIPTAWNLWLSLLLAPVWIVGMISLGRRDITSGSFWTLFFAVPVLGVTALSIDRPFFKERFFIQAQPAFEVLLATGFVTLWGIKNLTTMRNRSQASHFILYAVRFLVVCLLAVLLAANLLAFTNYQLDPAYAKAPPWQLYADYVSRERRPGDVMLTNFPEAAVSYYSPDGLPFYVVPAERDRSIEFRLAQTGDIAHAYRRIWFLPLLRQGFDDQGDVLNWLDRHADRVNQIFFPVYNINLYLSPPALEDTMISQPAAFAHGVRLRGYQILNRAGDSRLQQNGPERVLRLDPEEEFTLSLYWQAGGPTPVPYTVFVHLLAADGFNRTSQDNQPVWDTYPTTNWQPGEKITDKYTLTLPAGTPPGDHHLRVGWYQSDTREPVPVLDVNDKPVADYIVLDVIIRVE